LDPTVPEIRVVGTYLKAYRKELKTLIGAGTFQPEIPLPDEPCTPIMDLNVVKLRSGGSLDKLKNRLVVRGDLQKNLDEVSHSFSQGVKTLFGPRGSS
jgi:hypothetical protein